MKTSPSISDKVGNPSKCDTERMIGYDWSIWWFRSFIHSIGTSRRAFGRLSSALFDVLFLVEYLLYPVSDV